ncbi:peptidase domain-containing ABC transporter [Dictyobacter aurantiacus]|uniref:NHLP family bacteriocin export ABC transporter peptidase/permease/ATPase n=1 Tax=Dictyobacter aurantiacus TaxID=1936993 RepID=A0A401ZGR9_9CHLR|nr:peptidase domain-containing ABC transporter [Dictyobacter aurantiacus]GCE06075.1 NHLP family bacteriocin export ABC transporter peptidase/permease/ATPase [Dictyobacter aurantiacus]
MKEQQQQPHISQKGPEPGQKRQALQVPPRLLLPSFAQEDEPAPAFNPIPAITPAQDQAAYIPPSHGPQLLSLPSHPVPTIKAKPSPPAVTPETQIKQLSPVVTPETQIKQQEPTVVPGELPVRQEPPVAAASGSQTRKEPSKAAPRRQKRWRRVHELRQMSAVECGACCLAMILNYHGSSVSVSDVQERCGVGRDGLSALTIVQAARQYGLRVRTVSLKTNDFRFITLPAIAHWEFNHFVVIERCSKKYVDIIDPAAGRRRLSMAEFEEGFTGILMMLEPGANFERQHSTRTLSLWTYLRSLPNMQGIVTQIIGISILLQIFGLGTPLLTQMVIDHIIPNRSMNLLVMLGISMLFLIMMQGVLKLMRVSLLIFLQTRIDAKMMLNFLEHLLSLSYRFFQMRLNGDLLARTESNAAIRDLLTSQLISTLLDGSSVIIYLIVLIMQSKLFAGVTIAIGVLQVALLLTTASAIRRLTMRDLIAQGKTQGYLNEVLSGIATVKAAGAEQRALARWTNLFFDEMNISNQRNYLQAIVGIAFEILQILSPLLLLWVGATQVINGTMSVGSMLALSTLAVSFLVPLSSLAASGQKLQIANAHFDRLADVLGSESEQNLHQVQLPPKLKGNLELKNVSFQYDPNTPAVLKDITLRIQPGQKVALVGKTGSGKSTLGKLLIGLITPTKGEILYDGLSLQQLNYQEVRRQFGVVLQESFIFSGSVRENISFNNPDLNIKQIMRAAKAAAIHEDIEKMPMGYETLLSEGGSVFSGGQRQRLALARALANHPALILLDEATSALDVTTERAVEQSLNRLSCTQIVIAHRLSTIRNADFILVLDEGHIVEQGTHQQLLQRRGFYAKLIAVQMENGEIGVA